MQTRLGQLTITLIQAAGTVSYGVFKLDTGPMFFLISNRQGSPFASGKRDFFSYIQGQTVFQATVRGQKCTHIRIKEFAFSEEAFTD